MLNWRLIRKSLAYSTMRKKIFAVFGIILVYRFLASVPLPLEDPVALKDALDNLFTNQDVLSLFDAFSGGALSNFSIVALGLGPYINASIIMQLVTKAIPSLEEKQKEGEDGRRKINQYTRILSVPFAVAQSIALIFYINSQVILPATGEDFIATASSFEWALIVGAMTAGSVLMMWMGEILTEQNLGNGITLLIVAGIAASIPQTISTFTSTLQQGWGETSSIFGWYDVPFSISSYITVFSILAVMVAMVFYVVKLNEAYRIITISNAKRVQGSKAYGGVESILPIKLLLAGVIPIIFAYTFMTAPVLIAQILSSTDSQSLQDIGLTLAEYFPAQGSTFVNPNIWIRMFYPVTYFALVLVFTFFYTNLQFNAKDMAEDLQKKGAFIAGVRPGEKTEQYLSRVVNRLTLFGGLALATMSVLPIIAGWYVNIAQLALSATSILILVSGSLETMRQVESNALVVTYDE